MMKLGTEGKKFRCIHGASGKVHKIVCAADLTTGDYSRGVYVNLTAMILDSDPFTSP